MVCLLCTEGNDVLPLGQVQGVSGTKGLGKPRLGLQAKKCGEESVVDQEIRVQEKRMGSISWYLLIIMFRDQRKHG